MYALFPFHTANQNLGSVRALPPREEEPGQESGPTQRAVFRKTVGAGVRGAALGP